MKTEKYLDENGISTLDESKAKFIKIISFDDETGEAIRSWTIKINENKIYKVRAYIKKPSDAPPGVKVYIGSEGGHYYNTTDVGISPHSKVRLKRPDEAPKGVKVREDEEGFYYNSDEVYKTKIYIQEKTL